MRPAPTLWTQVQAARRNGLVACRVQAIGVLSLPSFTWTTEER